MHKNTIFTTLCVTVCDCVKAAPDSMGIFCQQFSRNFEVSKVSFSFNRLTVIF